MGLLSEGSEAKTVGKIRNLTAQSEGDDPRDSLPRRTEQTEKAHSKKTAEEEANGEAKEVKDHSLRCRECSSVCSSGPRSLPSLRLHSGVCVWGGAGGSGCCKHHPCRSTTFEGRNLTDSFKGFVEEMLHSSFERIKVQLVENNKIKICVSYGSLTQTETGEAGADTPCSSHSSYWSKGRGGDGRVRGHIW